jgi:DNA ligase-1
MKKPWEIIAELEFDNSRLAKEAIIDREAAAGNKELFDGFKLALDCKKTFGLKQVPEKKNENGDGLSWDGFISVVQRLCNRELTGNVARSAVDAMMNTATKTEWNNWFRRILVRDLRCGVSEKTINNVVSKKFPEFSVPVFSCQLAHDSSNHESKLSGKKILEVKLDGVRVLTIVYPDGRVDQFSRNGKELINFEDIKSQISSLAETFTEPMVLDGEVMSKSFQDLMKSVHRKYDVNTSDALLYLFDAIPLKDFDLGVCKIKQSHRSRWLKDWYENHSHKLSNVRILDQAVVDLDTENGQKLFSMYNKSAIENGYEGLVIKNIDAPYQCKRSADWLKMKPFIEVSLSVVSVEEGTGRNVDRLGALVCEGVDDQRHIQVNVGSGFTDEDRKDFWKEKENIIGQIVEVRADAITQNQDGTFSLRFPRFLRFRGFEKGEKL